MAVGPYDFTVNIPNPGEAFVQSFAMAQKQRQMQDRQQRYAQWIGRLQQDRSPETMSAFMLEFPEMSEAITKAYAPLDAARKENQLGLYGQALSALDRGDTDMAKQMIQERLAAARNTMGSEQEVKELEYGLSLIDSNPAALRSGLATTVYSLDPKRYEALYKAPTAELTSFQKDLIAAGIDPTSEAGKAKAKEYVSLKVDPIVQMPTPDGGQFIGRQSEYYRMFGQDAPPPERKDIPTVGEVRNGYRFNGGDPANERNWTKVDDMNGVPAPEVGANGMPARLTPAQYAEVVRVKGKAKTDEWMRRNNITVSGQ